MGVSNALSVARAVLDILLGLGVPGAVVWFVRDRVKSRAASQVAQATVGAEITTVETAALEAHVTYVEKAFDAERQSMQRQVGELNTEVARLRGEVQARDQIIRDLRDQVAALTTQMEALHQHLTNLPLPEEP